MKNYYRVAQHLFSISIPDEYVSDGLFSNYDPFQIEPSEVAQGDELAFDMTFVDELDISDYETVLVDKGPKEMSRTDLYKKGEDWIFEIAPVKETPLYGRIYLTGDLKTAKVQLLSNRPNVVKYVLNTSAMLVFAFSTSTKDTLEMHSSVTVKDGKGYLFLGKSGTGKSTHSSLWQKYIGDTWLLNDDNPAIRIIDGTCFVFGTPWSGKTPCYKNKVVPVGAIVSLEQYPENIIKRESLVEAYADMYSSCSGLKFEKNLGEVLHKTMETVVLTVPFFHLKCLPDEGAARLCYNTVSKL